MKYILVIDTDERHKYKYNLWEVHTYEDGAVSEDARVLETDDLELFLLKMKRILQ